jgi:hypothetical protein
MTFLTVQLASRVSFETSFDSKQPKLEPKLVSALSETESFSVSIEPKQIEEQQFDRELILGSYFFRFIRIVSVCFSLFRNSLFRNSLFRLFRLYTETESFDVLIEPKQTEEGNSLIESIFWYFSEDFRFFRFVSVCFDCFDIGSKHLNKPKFFVF